MPCAPLPPHRAPESLLIPNKVAREFEFTPLRQRVLSRQSPFARGWVHTRHSVRSVTCIPTGVKADDSHWAIRLASDQNQKAEFMNTARGHMIATSVGGTATGKGGDFIVADDLQNPEMSESKAEREQVIRFFDETLSTRLDDKRRGRIVVIQQRPHQADLTVHLLEQGGWPRLCLPAEFERRTVIPL